MPGTSLGANAARGIDSGEEGKDFRRVRIEIANLVDRAPGVAKIAVDERGAGGFGPALDAAPPCPFFESREAFCRHKRTGSRSHANRNCLRDVDRPTRTRLSGGWRRHLRRYTRERLRQVNSILQRPCGRKVGIDRQRSVHLGGCSGSIAVIQGAARGAQVRLKSLPAFPAVHAQPSCKMSSSPGWEKLFIHDRDDDIIRVNHFHKMDSRDLRQQFVRVEVR